MDLIFPHHENERAQSFALCGREFVRYWVHNGFVTVGEDQQKMAKSLKNFFTIKDVRSMFDAEALRYFLLTTHYRSPINFTLEGILSAEENVDYLYETILLARGATQGKEARKNLVEKEVLRFEEAMDDDFNTAVALAILLENARSLNECLRRKDWTMAKTHFVVIQKIGAVLGLGERDARQALVDIQEKRMARAKIDKALVERLVTERSEARKSKDFARADALREELFRMGVLVMDQKDGTKWKITSVKPKD
jgi:cysteinyl-tRNA synthetase